MFTAIIELFQHPIVMVLLIGALFVIGVMCIFVIGACVSCALIETVEYIQRRWYGR